MPMYLPSARDLKGSALDPTGKFVLDWQGHPDHLDTTIVVHPLALRLPDQR